MNEETIKHLKNSQHWQVFENWAKQHIMDLSYQDDKLLRKSDEKVGEEVKTNLKAAKTLAKIFQPFFEFQTKEDKSTEEIQRAKQKFGL